MGVGGESHAPAAAPIRDRLGTQCTEGWMGPRVGLNGCGKSPPPPTRIRFPDRAAPSESLNRLHRRETIP